MCHHCGPYDGEDSFFNQTYYVIHCKDNNDDGVDGVDGVDDVYDVDDDALLLLSSLLVSNLCSNAVLVLNFSKRH